MVGVRDYQNRESISNNEDIILRNLLRNKEKKQKREYASAVLSAVKTKEPRNSASVVVN